MSCYCELLLNKKICHNFFGQKIFLSRFRPFLLQGAKTGKDNGYTMLFDIESFDYSYYDEGSEGLKVALVHHLDMPIMRQTGFHIAPGTENQIAVTPTLIVTSPNAMSRFTPAERDCYSEDEISLQYLPRDHGYRYEMSNCLFESAFENILNECKCFPGKYKLILWGWIGSKMAKFWDMSEKEPIN